MIEGLVLLDAVLFGSANAVESGKIDRAMGAVVWGLLPDRQPVRSHVGLMAQGVGYIAKTNV